MEIFISWSGERSKHAAEALKNWLPKIINALKPWISSDLNKGTRWSNDIAFSLAQCKVGIICLTPENLKAEWILFEAGALSKVISESHVCPLLFDLDPTEVQGPLSQFQATRANKEEILKLLKTINSVIDIPLPESHIEGAFEMGWPTLERDFSEMPQEVAPDKAKRSERDMLEEVLNIVRDQQRFIRPIQNWYHLRPDFKASEFLLNETKITEDIPEKPVVPDPPITEVD